MVMKSWAPVKLFLNVHVFLVLQILEADLEVRGQTTAMYCTSLVHGVQSNQYQISTSLYKLPEAEAPNKI